MVQKITDTRSARAQIKATKVEESRCRNILVRWLITKDDGAKNFATRYFEVKPKGHSAHHSHSWEHEVFILDGHCLVECGDQEKRVGPSYAIFIPPNIPHSFRNVGDKTLKFLCLIPYEK